MNQKFYTKNKTVTLNNTKRWLCIFIAPLILLAIWLMTTLISFNPSDPSWSQTTWNKPTHNLGGIYGAWIADMLFFIFGVIAYIIPIIIISGCWLVWYQWRNIGYIDYFTVSLRLIGALALILTSCSLAEANIDDIWYFTSGGVIGSLMGIVLQPVLYSSSGTLALLCVWGTGLTLFTNWTWMSIAEKVGSIVLNILTYILNHTYRINT